ncbi:type IV pilus assembly protein FimV [Spartinivicinus ruber]|uniref:type IV pilus assembly protein FimV n=1 Tax=Spartinivicinus ruber TaxID=2683272 RepID=UPI0013D43985|nr:hypothetical protein [Spartinivicinus ruber]
MAQKHEASRVKCFNHFTEALRKQSKFLSALLACGVFCCESVSALGLGQLSLNSGLHQPLDAEIELIKIRELNQEEILAGLATYKTFDQAGIQRTAFLANMQFKTQFRGDGTAYIKVTSSSPVREPYLDFLVEVYWPKGRLQREYIALLDPPHFTRYQSSKKTAFRTASSTAYTHTRTSSSYQTKGTDKPVASKVNTTSITSNKQQSSSTTARQDDQLNIVTANLNRNTVTKQVANRAEEVAELKNELAMTQERLDKSQRERNEINDRLQELTNQVNTLKRLITLKDDQIKDLKEQLKEFQ